MEKIMQPIEEFDEKIHTGRILIFTPDYPKGDPMRFRIIDPQFVKFMYLVTHFLPVESLEGRNMNTFKF
jgi:hypothetical protein